MIRVGGSLAAFLLMSPASAQEDDLSALALSLVNDARTAEGLDALEIGGAVSDAAEAHANDMLARDYYGHASPEGEAVRDRYIDAGGSSWRVVAENIAACSGCRTPADAERVREFQNGWMQSPGHRANILMPGLDRFGFGIASGDGEVYAVQVFAGPGTAPGAPSGGTADRAGEAELQRAALAAVNAARQEAGQPPLESSEELDSLAGTLAEDATFEGDRISLPSDVFGLLPEESAGWTGVAVSAAACGGCGAFPAEGDGAHFGTQLAPAQGAEAFTHFGFALRANGEGRKVAVGVFARR